MISLNCSMSQRQDYEDPRDEYEISLVPDEKRAGKLAEELKQEDTPEIVIKNWHRYVSPVTEDGVLANLKGNEKDIGWAETRAYGISGHPPVDWVLAHDGYIEAVDLSPEQRVGILIGTDIFGALAHTLGEENAVKGISDYFAKRVADKLSKRSCTKFDPTNVDKGSVWGDYRRMLYDHIGHLSYGDSLPFNTQITQLDEESNSGRIHILGLEGKTINLTTLDERKNINKDSYHSPLSDPEMKSALNSIAVGILLPAKQSLKYLLLDK